MDSHLSADALNIQQSEEGNPLTDSPGDHRLGARLEELLYHLEVTDGGDPPEDYSPPKDYSAMEHAGVPTGLAELDRMLGGGLRPQTVTVLGARPGVGKSSLAMSIAGHVARNAGTVAYFGLAETSRGLAAHWLSSTARVNVMTLRAGMSQEEPAQIWPRLVNAAALCFQDPLYGFAGPSTVERVADICGSFDDELALVVVDYLQLLRDPGTQPRNDQLALYMRTLKDVAADRRVSVLVVSQLSRALESRPDRRPCLFDLRDSGSIEDTADVVLLLYRDDYYNPRSDHKGLAEIHIAKQRAGPTGVALASFAAEYGLITGFPFTLLGGSDV